MDYVGTVIRPPAEGDSILLQVTTGCSHNKCAFCGAYKDKRFSIKDPEIIHRDIEFARKHFPNNRRLFICDGDALIIPQHKLLDLIARIKDRLPAVKRIASYANAKSIKMKSDAELRELREAGLTMLYMGLESGDDEILRRMNKYGTAETMVTHARRVINAGFKLNVTVLLGLGGEEASLRHARRTGEALSAMDPHQAAALTLMLIPGTPLHEAEQQGEFTLPGPESMLRELKTMLEHTHLSKGLFLANHASNYLPLKLRLPRDKEDALALIDQALQNHGMLTPESRRRL